MKSTINYLLGLLLAACSVMNAGAASVQFADTFFVPADMSGAGTLQTFSFAGGDPDALAGDTFIYDFLFNTPPPASSFAFLVLTDDPATVEFSDLGLFASDTVTPILDFSLFLSSSMAGGYGILDSGVYDLRFSGDFLANAGSFTGVAEADPADVPEPVDLALLLVGMVAVAATRWRVRSR